MLSKSQILKDSLKKSQVKTRKFTSDKGCSIPSFLGGCVISKDRFHLLGGGVLALRLPDN